MDIRMAADLASNWIRTIEATCEETKQEPFDPIVLPEYGRVHWSWEQARPRLMLNDRPLIEWSMKARIGVVGALLDGPDDPR